MNTPMPVRAAANIGRLRNFVVSLATLLDSTSDEPTILDRGAGLLRALIADDDWLPEAFARPNPDRYQQYLLHCDSRERFSVVSFVWGAGQATPVHDHQVWGLVGVLRGAERVESFDRAPDGKLVAHGPDKVIEAGHVDAVSPAAGDIHRVTNASPDVSVSIHVYGANIGAVERATYDETGRSKPFISGYANTLLPNLWDRSRPA